MNHRYRLMTIDTVVQLLNESGMQTERTIVRDSFGINLDLDRDRANPMMVERIMTPFHIKDNRILRILSGHVRIEINFTIYELAAGDVLFITEDSYFQLLELSDELKGEVVAFVRERFMPDMPIKSSGAIHLHPEEKDWEEIGHLMYTIYVFALHEPFREKVTGSLLNALVNNILCLAQTESGTTAVSAQELIFKRFVEELGNNRNGKQSVSHYADILCITPQYLSKAVTSVSGETASKWINKAVILEARIRLRDTSRSIVEISDSLNFPNTSFFCRFFKRETGQTPTQYRRELK